MVVKQLVARPIPPSSTRRPVSYTRDLKDPLGRDYEKASFMILTTLSLLVMLTTTSVYAQSDMRLKVNIPFEFSVGKKILPAGEYSVRYMVPSALVIESVDLSASQSFFTLATQAKATRDESALIFNRYGDQYFLSTIWIGGTPYGHELVKHRAEEELIQASRALAKSESERQTVSIVAHR